MNKKYLRKTILFFALLFFLAVFSQRISIVQAGRGCCSYHGGQSYCDTSVGRWVCNDGRYSPSCTCTYSPPIVREPTPTPVLIPKSIQGNIRTIYNKKGSYSVVFDWDNIPKSTGYSVGISKSAGANPGPLVDTTQSRWTFNNISPGKWYVNLKSKVGNYWSNTVYWDLMVPPLPTPTSTPTNTPIPTVASKPTEQPEASKSPVLQSDYKKEAKTNVQPKRNNLIQRIFEYLFGWYNHA